MPQRDDREFESKRQQIIDGALEVFATKGFEKATNKDIAEATGGISPGLIYHYFEDKADLLRHVIEQRAPMIQLLAHPETFMNLPLRDALIQFGNAFVQTAHSRTAAQLMKLMLGEAARSPQIAELVNTIGPGRIFVALGRYFGQQMDAGVMRRMDPGIAVRCFVGPLLVFILSREIFPQPDTPQLHPQEYVQTAIEIFLRGVLVRPA